MTPGQPSGAAAARDSRAGPDRLPGARPVSSRFSTNPAYPAASTCVDDPCAGRWGCRPPGLHSTSPAFLPPAGPAAGPGLRVSPRLPAPQPVPETPNSRLKSESPRPPASQPQSATFHPAAPPRPTAPFPRPPAGSFKGFSALLYCRTVHHRQPAAGEIPRLPSPPHPVTRRKTANPASPRTRHPLINTRNPPAPPLPETPFRPQPPQLNRPATLLATERGPPHRQSITPYDPSRDRNTRTGKNGPAPREIPHDPRPRPATRQIPPAGNRNKPTGSFIPGKIPDETHISSALGR